MVKVSSSDILAILRKFELAADDNTPRNVEHVTFSHPQEFSTLVGFRFNKHDFYLLFDHTAEDDTAYIAEQVQTARSDKTIVGEVLPNPQESSLMTYGLPYKGKDAYLFEVITGKKRLDIHLAESHPAASRSTWQKHVKAGHISVNGNVVTSPRHDIAATDQVAINVPELTDFSSHELPIIYLDDNVIVINKAAGVLTHSKGALNDEFTVAEFFKRYSTYNTDTNRPGIVHRLDRDTSGVMIGARNPETAALLQRQFADRKVKKTYYAVIDGTVANREALIDLPIGRNPSAPSTFRVDPKGKPAQTAYRIIAANSRYSLIELRPQTGRTHQLRVHMQFIHTPIHGDRVYGKPADRLYLHAHSLEITIPTSDRRVFTAPTPDAFEQLAGAGDA